MQIGKNSAMAALSKLFLVFPQASGNEAERTARFAAYWEVLERQVPRYLIEACEYASKGKLSNGHFLPTAGDLYQCAQAFAARDVAQRWPRAALSDPPIRHDPQTKARIQAGFKKLLVDLRSGCPIDPDRATKEVFDPWAADKELENG